MLKIMLILLMSCRHLESLQQSSKMKKTLLDLIEEDLKEASKKKDEKSKENIKKPVEFFNKNDKKFYETGKKANTVIKELDSSEFFNKNDKDMYPKENFEKKDKKEYNEIEIESNLSCLYEGERTDCFHGNDGNFC